MHELVGEYRPLELRKSKDKHLFQIDEPESLRSRVKTEGILVHYSRGEMLFRQGREANKIYLTTDGIVAITRTSVSDARQIFGFVSADSLIIPAVGDKNVVAYSTECLTDVSAYVISAHALGRILQSQPTLLFSVQREWSQDIERAHAHLENLLCRHGIERVAFMLMKLHLATTAQPAASSPSTISATRKGSWIGITQVDLAAAIGMTPVYLNQILKKMKDARIVELKSGKVRIIDITALQALYV